MSKRIPKELTQEEVATLLESGRPLLTFDPVELQNVEDPSIFCKYLPCITGGDPMENRWAEVVRADLFRECQSRTEYIAVFMEDTFPDMTKEEQYSMEVGCWGEALYYSFRMIMCGYWLRNEGCRDASYVILSLVHGFCSDCWDRETEDEDRSDCDLSCDILRQHNMI